MDIQTEHIFSFIAGAIVASVLLRFLAANKLKEAKEEANRILDIAKKEAQIASDKARNDAEHTLKQKEDMLEREYQTRRSELRAWERNLENQSRDNSLERGNIKRRELELIEARQQHDSLHREYRNTLESISQISSERARELLKQDVRKECQGEINALKEEILNANQEDLDYEAKRILIDTLQRISSGIPGDTAATMLKLPNEEMKGRIIGREGRNIHSFEAATGTTLMIDETPETVMVSSFDPVRREIAKNALEALISDGRIHPASIESSVKDAEEAMKGNIIKLGIHACEKLKIRGLDNELYKHLGKLHFYLSNNQRTLEHSVEVAYICSMMASEIGLDPEIAKRAGLFHDIGKGISHEFEGSHAEAGALLLKTHGEATAVINAVQSSHNEVKMESPYAALVQIADALSSTRPGVRSETIDGYVQRIKSLEELALSFDGVQDAYALRGGREVRIIVNPLNVSDQQAAALARKIRIRIEEEYHYPGSIKVLLIREQRFDETAT